MKLKLKNVGKIKHAEIELQGITVIAGENNTGKSTIGKMLYCIFDSFYRINEQIEDERYRSIRSLLTRHIFEHTDNVSLKVGTKKLAELFVNSRNQKDCDEKWIEQELRKFFEQLSENIGVSDREWVDSALIQSLTKKIYIYLNVSDSEIQETILQKRLQAEFGMKIGHVNNPDEQSDIMLEIQKKRIAFSIFENKEIEITDYVNLLKDICYIDDPFVLDELGDEWRMFLGFQDECNHRSNLITKLTKKNDSKGFNMLDEVLIKRRLNHIFETMDNVCKGDLVSSEKAGSYVYRTPNLKDELSVASLSTGIKSFVILRTLLQNGSIDENGIIIMDEPEIHLHPQWQLKFAELIVLLQKEFGANILLNTHSPYFLNAIQVYSEKYDIETKCRYYMTNEVNDRIQVSDVSANLEVIYEKLARPLQELENLAYL